MGREAAKISALSSKNLLNKYDYLTGEDLGHKPSALESTKFQYSPLGLSFSKAFEKDKAKSGAKSESDFDYDSNHKFYGFYKGCDEFEEMSLDSKYNKLKKINKHLIHFKSVKPKNEKMRLKKERIMKNVVEIYKNYYYVCKLDYDNNDNLNKTKKKSLNTNNLNCLIKQIKSQN